MWQWVNPVNYPNDDLEDVTLHSSYEGNIVATIPVFEGPVNQGSNQVIFSLVDQSSADPKNLHLFDNKQR